LGGGSLSKLPEGWINVPLSDVARWGSGGTPSRANSAYYGGDIPWVKTGELGQGLIKDTEENITDLGLQNSSAKIFPKGSVLIAMYGATIGKTAILGIDAATNQACAVAIPREGITTTEYLFHYLLSQKDEFIEAGKGAAQPNISQKVIKDWTIPLASFDQQKRIADKLNSLLARVDACRDRLNRLPRILEHLRQSVLSAATSGELTEDWREEDSWEDGRPVNWCLKTFGELVESSLYGPRFSAKSYSADGVPTIRTTDIDFDGAIVLQDTPRVSVSSQELEKWGLLDGDLLVTRTGSTIGKCAVYHKSLGIAIPSAYLIRFRLNQHDIIPKFVLLFLLSPKGQSLLISSSNAVAQPNVNAKTISQFLVPIPPLSEQREIVRRVEKLFTYVERLEARYQKALRRVEQLTSSLLSTAFRGELVPQDPNDEPASVLLDRIRAEQAAQPTKPKRGETRRKPTMTKMSDESVKEVIRQLPKDTFSFDELCEKLPDDKNYDLLKDILFDLLDKADIRQVFDRQSQAMRFVKGHK
jgi:type I restriction enzyme S subunit